MACVKPSMGHERILIELITEMEKKGYRIIRLDKRIVPDAVAIDFENKKVIALEASTNSTSVYITKMKYPIDFGRIYDDILIASPRRQGTRTYYPLALRLKAIELRECGMPYHRIKDKLGVKGYGSVYRWCHSEALLKIYKDSKKIVQE